MKIKNCVLNWINVICVNVYFPFRLLDDNGACIHTKQTVTNRYWIVWIWGTWRNQIVCTHQIETSRMFFKRSILAWLVCERLNKRLRVCMCCTWISLQTNAICEKFWITNRQRFFRILLIDYDKIQLTCNDFFPSR